MMPGDGESRGIGTDDPLRSLLDEEFATLLDALIDSWPVSDPPMSDHLSLEVAAVFTLGRSLEPGEPVPGCGCPTCTGLPEDHPARVPAWRHADPEAAARTDAERRARWESQVAAARRIPILDIVQRLGCGAPVRRGKHLLVCCPLHDDLDPSLRMDVGSGLWYCDPCGEGGDGIRLYMRARRLQFTDAVRELRHEDHALTATASPVRRLGQFGTEWNRKM